MSEFVLDAWSAKEPSEVRSRDVVNFVAAQRSPRTGAKVVRLNDGGAGLSSRTVARRLSSLLTIGNERAADARRYMSRRPLPAARPR